MNDTYQISKDELIGELKESSSILRKSVMIRVIRRVIQNRYNHLKKDFILKICTMSQSYYNELKDKCE